MFGRGTNDRRITEFVQRFDAIDERIAAIDGRLLLALQVAAGSSEAVKATSLQLAALREDGQPPASSARTDGAAIADQDRARADDGTLLTAWVRWLVHAYDLGEGWPLCWHRHAGLVAQLVALRRWHLALRAELSDDPTAATSWHDALYRMHEHWTRPVAQGCLATHRDAPLIDVSGLHDVINSASNVHDSPR